MTKMWIPQQNTVIKSWLEAIINEAEEKLTDWERNFIESIEGQISSGFILSEKQEKILERIYADKTS